MFLLLGTAAFAQTNVQLDAQTLKAQADVYFSPRTASFVESSTFEVPILVDTKIAASIPSNLK